MKKFLLTLAAAALCSSAALAETVTFDFANNAYGLPNDQNSYVTVPATVTDGEVTLTLNGDENSWRYWTDGLREYNKKNPTLTVTAGEKNITSISWTVKSGVKFALTSGGDAIASWEGSAPSVTLYADVSTGNAAIETFTVNYGEGGSENPGGGEDNPPVTPGDGEDVTIVWADQGYENAQDLTTFTQDGITYSFSAGSNSNAPKYYVTGTAIRLYGGNSMTLSVPEGTLMTQVVFTVGSSNPFNAASTASVGTFNVENATWTSTAGAQSVTFTQGGASGHVRIEKMVITLVSGTGGETPDPDQPDQPTETITVAEALAILEGGQTNVEATVKGIISQIDEVSAQYGNATYFIKDALTDANALEVFRGYWLNGDKFTEGNEIEVGATVVVTGTLVDYNGTYEFTTGSKILSYEAPTGDVPTPPTPETPEGQYVTFDFTNPAEYGFDVEDVTEIDLTGESFESDNVTIAFNTVEGASTNIRFWNSNGNWTMRFYKDTDFTVSVPEGYVLTGIEFDGTNLGKDWTYSNGSLEGNTWTPTEKVSSVTIGKSATGNNPTIKSMTVFYTDGEGGTTGVESIETAEGKAVYFNLQGVRVNNPDRGIFIKVQNGKAVKMVK